MAHFLPHGIRVGNAHFLALASFLSETTAKLMPSRKTSQGWVSEEFDKRKIREWRARHKIHLSVDLWTSPNRYGMSHYTEHRS